jgi:glycerol-1-phosphatase
VSTLAGRYAAVVCDLDGVVYRGPAAVAHAVEALSSLSVPVVYATNNASRPPAEVAAHLVELGLAAVAHDVVTSSQAAAWLLGRDDTPRGAPVLAVGGAGVAAALEEAGFVAVRRVADSPSDVVAVVQGYGPDVTAADLAEAAYVIEAGGRWVATNTDATLPTDRGVAPGNGSLVGAVARAVGKDPDLVAGKPHPPLYLLAADRLDVPADRVLAVGDRLDTDIEGAVRAGADSLLVLTGVDDLEAALDAPAERRPTYVTPDLRWLHDDPDAGEASVARLAAAVRAVHAATDAGAAADADRARDEARGLLRAMAAR